MAIIVIAHKDDPNIGMMLGDGPADGFYGKCTQCGFQMHRWELERAIRDASEHVDAHDPVVD